MFVKTSANTFECWVMPQRRSLEELFETYSVDGPAPDMETLREEIGEDIAREYDLSDVRHEQAGRE
jgi:hypothetical protein